MAYHELANIESLLAGLSRRRAFIFRESTESGRGLLFLVLIK